MSQFDVFLCHNSIDKPMVKEIGRRLKKRGIVPWLDEWELQPGLPWQRALEQQIKQIRAAAVFVGPNGFGPWQDLEQAAFLRQFVQRQCPVIPVILPDCQQTPELPIFLADMMWIDFRQQEPDPLEQLIWGITGHKPDHIRDLSGPDLSSSAPDQPLAQTFTQLLEIYLNTMIRFYRHLPLGALDPAGG